MPTKQPALQDYEPLAEAARRLGVTPSLVARWCRDGKLPCIKANKRAWLVVRAAKPTVARRGAKGRARE